MCSRTGCARRAVATLTYAYAERAAVIGPLALRAEPNSYDLCREHCEGLSTPKGWELIRLPMDQQATAAYIADDLVALADAVREVGMTWDDPRVPEPPATEPVIGRRKGHLGVVADAGDPDA